MGQEGHTTLDRFVFCLLCWFHDQYSAVCIQTAETEFCWTAQRMTEDDSVGNSLSILTWLSSSPSVCRPPIWKNLSGVWDNGPLANPESNKSVHLVSGPPLSLSVPILQFLQPFYYFLFVCCFLVFCSRFFFSFVQLPTQVTTHPLVTILQSVVLWCSIYKT